MYRKSKREGVGGVLGVACLRRDLRSSERLLRAGVDLADEGVLKLGLEEEEVGSFSREQGTR